MQTEIYILTSIFVHIKEKKRRKKYKRNLILNFLHCCSAKQDADYFYFRLNVQVNTGSYSNLASKV